MTSKQENKLSMYLPVQKTCNAHKSVWSGVKAYVDTFGEFENTIKQIQDARQVQEGKITGVSAKKQQVVDTLVEKTVVVASAVYAYGDTIGEPELQNKVSYSPSQLGDSRDTILVDRCQLVHDEAADLITDLTDYGITAGVLSDLQKEIDAFKAILAGPRTAIGTRAEATSRLVELFEKGDNLLKDRIDKLTEQFRSKDEFYKQYHSARVIVDMGQRGETEEGEVEEKEGK